jgi:hypothetical protein
MILGRPASADQTLSLHFRLYERLLSEWAPSAVTAAMLARLRCVAARGLTSFVGVKEIMSTRIVSVILTSLMIAMGLACQSSAELPPQRTTQANPVLASPPPFTLVEQELVAVVMAPEGPTTPHERLLEIADYLHKAHSEHGRTVVIFRDPRRQVPARKLGRSEQFSLAFAVAFIDADAHVREVRTGVFN